jgi:hypothetical protein
MNSIEKYGTLFLFFLFFSFCATSIPRSSLKGTPVEYEVPNCGCSNPSIVLKQDIQKALFEEGIVRYSQRNMILIDPQLKEELLRVEVPSAYLHNYILAEEIPVLGNKVRAVATFDDSRFEKVLQTKPFVEEVGVKVYKRRGNGLRGLEVIKGFQKQRQGVESYEDTDKFVGDRVDYVERFKSN